MAESEISSAASSVVSSTLNSIATLVWNEINFVRDVPEKVQLIEAKLRIIQAFLKDAENKPQSSHLTAKWLREIQHVAYRAQDVIEKMNCLQRHRNRIRGCSRSFSRYSNIPRYLIDLREIGIEIDKTNAFIPGINGTIDNLSGVNIGESSSMANQIEDQWDPRTKIHISDENEVVGFDGEIRTVINELLDPENEQLSVVTILGMGGIGKSTLARTVFNDSNVKKKFDSNIWITISQRYDVLSLQKKILKAVIRIENKDLEKLTIEEMREKISNSLKRKRYLIVIDDIWTIESWNDINPHNSTFPNMNNGSRIILTSRNLEVGNHPEAKHFVHQVNPLDDEKSWQLLKRKALPPYVTVSDIERNQLESLGLQLARKCKGLPLALIVLGGYLSKHLDYQTWSRMAKSVDWNEVGNQINISEILALSYHDLPKHLKPAFLYITTFPEDEVIKTNDLLRLWISEGFIHSSQNYTLETVAQIYLDQLYERGLVQVVRKSRTHGRISRIRIHDVLRDWGIDRAKKEEFFHVIKGSNDTTSSFHEYVPYRVSLYGVCDEDITTSMPHLRSFLGFELPIEKVYVRNLGSMRVVKYLTTRPLYRQYPNNYPRENLKYLKHMILLRYLFLNHYATRVYFPASIGKLSYLQTLYCRAQIWSLPSSLWEISTLRHVYLSEICCNWKGPKIGSGQNIQTLHIAEDPPRLVRKNVCWMHTGMDGLTEALEDMKQIVQLCLFSYKSSFSENVLRKVSNCRHLEVLDLNERMSYELGRMTTELVRIPHVSVFPPGIRKICIECGQLVEDPMPVLEKLPQLIVLKILSYGRSDVGNRFQSMHCTRGGFPQLKYLRLMKLSSFEEWKVEVGAMPILYHLKLRNCEALKMFPEELMEHPQLQVLEMVQMPRLSGFDYSRLQNKGCKLVITEDYYNNQLSDF